MDPISKLLQHVLLILFLVFGLLVNLIGVLVWIVLWVPVVVIRFFSLFFPDAFFGCVGLKDVSLEWEKVRSFMREVGDFLVEWN